MTDVLIVGAGPTGLTLALELTSFGHRVRLIDKKEGPSTESKALGIQPRTLEILDQLGIVHDFLEQGEPKKGMCLHFEQKQLLCSLETLDTPYPFILSLPQSASEKILIHHLAANGLAVEWGTQLLSIENGVCLLKKKEGSQEYLTPKWIVGCDGAHSCVRESFKTPFEGNAYAETFALADMKAKTTLDPNYGHMFLGKKEVCLLFPFPTHLYRTVFRVNTPSEHVLENYTPTFIEKALHKRGVHVLFKPDRPSWVSLFTIQTRCTHKMRIHHNVFLAGDAAHIHSPAGGQGMNTSIQDAHNLAWKLDLVLKEICTPTLLDSYEQERKPVIAHVLKMTKRMTNMLLVAPAMLRPLFYLLMKQAVRSKHFFHKMICNISQLSVNYRHSRVIFDPHPHWTGPKPGERAPNALLATGEHLFALLRTRKTTLLLFQPNIAFVAICRQRFGQWLNVLVVEGAEVQKKYAAKPNDVYLIRPDGYVGYRSHCCNADEIAHYFSLLHTTPAASQACKL